MFRPSTFPHCLFRRTILCLLPLLAIGMFRIPAAPAAEPPREVPLRWLDDAPPPVPQGVTWGVPWARGLVQKTQTFSLRSSDGTTFPLQTWPLAYWPDGTLKWTGMATVAAPGAIGPFTIVPGDAPAQPQQPVRIQNGDTTLEIDTGPLQCRIVKWGSGILDSLVLNGRQVARKGELVCILQEGAERNEVDAPARERYLGHVEKVTVEQSGPVRAVIKLEGKHKGLRSQRQWLPFVVRLYFYAGDTSVRLVHTIIYDGDEQKDFVRGIGLTFGVPFREEVQNRHVRFSGEGAGLWAEPVQLLKGRDGRFVADPSPVEGQPTPQAGRAGSRGPDVYPRQLQGQRVPNSADVDAASQSRLADWAVWDAFKLVQPNADGFTVVKRTNDQSAWLPAGAGKRASGLVFVGDVTGGLAIGLKNFWQSYPASLEIQNASTPEARLTAWIWSPDAPAMDMRHYDTRAHGLESVYEDVQPGMSIPLGVARTSELMLFATPNVPQKPATVGMARATAAPPVLLPTPQYLHGAQAFGLWGLEDRSTPVKQAIEDNLKRTLDFYVSQVDQHHWYGFWDFGDVMHSYDDLRHVWRYDLGGMAWDNSELGTDMWLWYSFLRTGRADIFRMAEAMTRHTGEVDTYHLGPFAGLGSRHNVRHWGCGSKEARISQAAYRRFYYYLTADERTGDIMREVLNADFRTVDYDPMRLARPITDREKAIAPTRARLGPDWFAFVSNWMTEYERTLDPRWRDKILAGARSLAQMPLGLRTGRNLLFGYDPNTGKLFQLDDTPGTYNLATIMGGAEVVFELNMMLDDPAWEKLFLQYCRLYSAPADLILRDMQTGAEGADASFVRDGRLASYVYIKTQQPAFLQAGLDALLARARGGSRGTLRHVQGPDALNPIDEGLGNTNGAAQSGLETITMLGMIGDKLPPTLPAAESGQGAGRSPGRGRGARGGGGSPTGGAE
jgi:hypothetical protein